MNNKIKKKPDIRFKGFSDSWEQRKLGEYLDFSNIKNKEDKYSRAEVLSVSSTLGVVNQLELKGRSFAGVSLKGYYVVQERDVIYAKSISSNNPYGTIRTNRIHEGVVSPLYAIYRPKDNLHPEFAQVYFELDIRMNNYIFPLVNMGDRFIQVSGQAVISGDVVFPGIEEQRKISDFFDSLDRTIALHQRELDLMKQEKQTLLSKMFPKNGERFPEIRFKGFTDAWEQRKLGDLSTKIQGGGTPRTSVLDYWNGDIPWLQSSDITEHKVFDANNRKYVTKLGVVNSATKLVSKNSIAVVTRVGVGKLALMSNDYTTSQDFLSLSDLQTDANFLVYSLYKKLQNELHMTQGTSIKGITKDELVKKVLSIPVEQIEQVKIGQFFKTLDDTIAFHQQQLDVMKTIKKTLLKSMFI